MEPPVTYEDWGSVLRKGAAHFGLSLSDQQVRLCHRHAELLSQWNRKTNLTAIRDPFEVAIKHFVDSFGPVGFLTPMQKVLDVGSGGGFPGLPLKVLSSAIDLTLVDAVRKKVNFLQHVIRELQLRDVRALHQRVETLSHRDDRPLFDTIVCRAFSDLASIVSHAVPLLAAEGKIVVWKGRMPDQEIREADLLLKEAGSPLVLSARSYRLPVFAAERTLVIVAANPTKA